MKNISVTLLFIAVLTATANAQVAFESGLNMANLSIKSQGEKMSTTFKNGAIVGVVADMALGDHVYFQPGLFYEMRGCKITDPKGEYSMNTIGIPLNIIYKTGEKCGSRAFFGGGPYLGYNLSGSYVIAPFGAFPETSGEIKFGAPQGSMKKVDLGIGLNLGYLFNKHFYFRLRYQMGMSSLYISENSDNTLKTSSIGITLGYLIGRCKGSGTNTVYRTAKSNHWRGMSKGKYSRKHLPH